MLVHIVNSTNRALYEAQLAAMFRQRKTLFVDLLDWPNMSVVGDEERDFVDDDPDVQYLVNMSETGAFIGALRISPTTGAHLLGGPLADYIQVDVERGPHVWEVSRLCPATDLKSAVHGVSFGFLTTGMIEWALRHRVTRLWGISEPRLIASAARGGWRVRLLGEPVYYDDGKAALAFEIPIDMETLAITREAHGLLHGATFYAGPSVKDPSMTPLRIKAIDQALTDTDSDLVERHSSDGRRGDPQASEVARSRTAKR